MHAMVCTGGGHWAKKRRVDAVVNVKVRQRAGRRAGSAIGIRRACAGERPASADGNGS